MSAAPACSVIIPVYCCEKYIEACLRSVQTQSLEDIEILVIDDSSPDASGQIAAEMARADKRIRYFRLEKNQGVAAARNRGVLEARSAWIAFLDSDDMWTTQKLERQFELQKETGAQLIYTGARCMDQSGTPLDRCFQAPQSVDYEALLKGNDIVCSSVLTLRSLLLQYPMQHSELHEDYITWLLMLRGGNCKTAGITEPLVFYRLAEGSKSGNKWRSACMTWKSYRCAGVPFFKRCTGFAGYVVHGLRRYWG